MPGIVAATVLVVVIYLIGVMTATRRLQVDGFAQSPFVNCTAPQLTNELVAGSCDIDINACDSTCSAPLTNFGLNPFTITVSYDGNGPFWVEWFFKSTIFFCNSSYLCSNTTTNNSQKLSLSPSARPKDWSGTFVAVVHNGQGSNGSKFETFFNDHRVPISPPSKVEYAELNLNEGESLNYSCSMSANEFTPTLACFTKNKNESFNFEHWTENCVRLSSNCNMGYLNNSNITIHRTYKPFPNSRVEMNFEKEELNLRDSGMIYCAFVLSAHAHSFARLNLTVVTKNNVIIYALTSSGGSVFVIVVIALIVVLVVAVVWQRWKKKKAMSSYREVEDPERRPLCPDSQTRYNQYSKPAVYVESPRSLQVGNPNRGNSSADCPENTPSPPSIGDYSLIGYNQCSVKV